jgi:FixJ family two-component response regulator
MQLPPLVAIVDDEAAVRTMLRRVLCHADCEVVALAPGEEYVLDPLR